MDKKMSIKLIKITGVVIGLAATLLANYSQEKELEKAVAEKVQEALANK